MSIKLQNENTLDSNSTCKIYPSKNMTQVFKYILCKEIHSSLVDRSKQNKKKKKGPHKTWK